MLLHLVFACSGEHTDSALLIEDTDERLQLGDIQACPQPLAAVRYEEVGETWGLTGSRNPDADHLNGGGLVIEDIDSDGDLDLLIFYDGDPPVLYRHEAGEMIREELDLPEMIGAPTVFDLTADGHLDILLGNGALLMGDGSGGFTGRPLNPQGIKPGFVELLPDDVDGDGQLDLLALRNHPDDDALMRDLILWGDGEDFIADTSTLSSAAAAKAFDARAFDWDRDGDRDFYVANDMGSLFGANVLWSNENGVLTDVSADCDCGIAVEAMGVSLGDFNADSWPDLYITGADKNVLLQGSEEGSFIDVTAALGADPMQGSALEMSWGSTFVDYDNDGDQDILVLQGDLWTAEAAEELAYAAPVHLMAQDGGEFSDVRAALGLTATGSYRAGIAADLNADGVQDLVISDVVERPRVYLSQGCTAEGWLAVTAPEHTTVTVELGSQVYSTVVSRDTGFSASSPPIAWFGLGSEAEIDRLTIVLPDGEIITARDVAGRRTIAVTAAAAPQ